MNAYPSSQVIRWVCFGVLFGLAIVLVTNTIRSKAARMKAADISPSALESLAPGSSTKAVVRLNQVAGANLQATLLRKVDDTVYELPASISTSEVAAVLNPDAAVVMGAQTAIVSGAIVQLAGTIDSNHTLHVNQVVILTGYVRLQSHGGGV